MEEVGIIDDCRSKIKYISYAYEYTIYFFNLIYFFIDLSTNLQYVCVRAYVFIYYNWYEQLKHMSVD